jgi:D-xylose transport system ATP-binding protein
LSSSEFIASTTDRHCPIRRPRAIGTYRTAEVTEDEVLGMIIAGKKVTRVAECLAPLTAA